MSQGVVNLQAQVESVLGALVKAATVELTKLFESRYRASAADVDVGPTDAFRTPDGFPAGGDTRRSIGVQVEQDVGVQVEQDVGSPLDVLGTFMLKLPVYVHAARMDGGGGGGECGLINGAMRVRRTVQLIFYCQQVLPSSAFFKINSCIYTVFIYL